jgi:hypothetical protein
MWAPFGHVSDECAGACLQGISVDPPTMSMTFAVNNSPFAGKEGTKVRAPAKMPATTTERGDADGLADHVHGADGTAAARV